MRDRQSRSRDIRGMILGYMAGAAAESPGSNAAGDGVTYALETVSSTRPLTRATVSRARARSQFWSHSLKFDDIRRLPLGGEDARSQALLTLPERSSTDLESVLGVSSRESESRIPPAMPSRDDRAGLHRHSGLAAA